MTGAYPKHITLKNMSLIMFFIVLFFLTIKCLSLFSHYGILILIFYIIFSVIIFIIVFIKSKKNNYIKKMLPSLIIISILFLLMLSILISINFNVNTYSSYHEVNCSDYGGICVENSCDNINNNLTYVATLKTKGCLDNELFCCIPLN